MWLLSLCSPGVLSLENNLHIVLKNFSTLCLYEFYTFLELNFFLMSKNIPNGLVFSAKSPTRKKRALLLVSVLAVLQVCLIWPVYPLFASPTPQVLGFPLSFVWVIVILILSFTSLFIFFRKDNSSED